MLMIMKFLSMKHGHLEYKNCTSQEEQDQINEDGKNDFCVAQNFLSHQT